MKRFLFILFLPLLWSGCAFVQSTPIVKEKPPQRYQKIVTLVVDRGAFNPGRFDGSLYRQYLQGAFNNLTEVDFRQHLERSLRRTLEGPRLEVLSSSELFGVGDVVSYQAFTDTLQQRGVEAVLLINLWNNRQSEVVRSEAGAPAAWDEETPDDPVVLCYLFDYATGRPFWMAKTAVVTSTGGFRVYHNHLARRIRDQLVVERYIYRPPAEYYSRP